MTSIDTITMYLPTPPDGFEYEVTQFSAQVFQVWLCHPDVYHYTDEPVRTIHSYIKNGWCHAPQNAKGKIRPERVAPLTKLFTLSPYSLMNPN